jgi:hypothetical protein
MSAVCRALDGINASRATLREADFQERMLALKRGDHASYDEAMEGFAEPSPATVNDVIATVAGLFSQARNIRAFVEKYGGGWQEHVRVRWLVGAEECEDRAQQMSKELGLDFERRAA